MTLNSTVRMPPLTRKVSPFRTGLYAAKQSFEYSKSKNACAHTLQEVRLEVHIKDVATQSLDRVVKW